MIITVVIHEKCIASYSNSFLPSFLTRLFFIFALPNKRHINRAGELDKHKKAKLRHYKRDISRSKMFAMQPRAQTQTLEQSYAFIWRAQSQSQQSSSRFQARKNGSISSSKLHGTGKCELRKRLARKVLTITSSIPQQQGGQVTREFVCDLFVSFASACDSFRFVLKRIRETFVSRSLLRTDFGLSLFFSRAMYRYCPIADISEDVAMVKYRRVVRLFIVSCLFSDSLESRERSDRERESTFLVFVLTFMYLFLLCC